MFAITFAKVYPLYVQKAECKNRTKEEVDKVICWLTGYDRAGLQRQIEQKNDLETFFAQAPAIHPNSSLIKGVVCGIRVEDIEDPLTQRIRYLDKLIDELAKGRRWRRFCGNKQTITTESTMSWWRRLFRGELSGALPDELRLVNLTMPGWTEDTPSQGMRVWRNDQGDILTLAASVGSLELPSLDDIAGLRRWCRKMAEDGGGGLIEVRTGAGGQGATLSLIYKRLEMPAYVFTGMLIIPGTEVSRVWTVVSGERGTTGVREAIVTTELMKAGRLTVADYQLSWAQDPYDVNYCGVDRSVLRFMSDDESYDEQFPDHPLSKVRRVLAVLPKSVQIDSSLSQD
jgi:hypothetical protein